MSNSKLVVTYPVAIVASVLAICFTALLVAAVIKGESIQVVLAALGTFLSVVGGIFAHRRVTPLARPNLPDDPNG